MSKPVLFASFRPLTRAENLHAAYDAYDGPKVHALSIAPEYRMEVLSGKYDVLVTDDFPTVTPGKCIMIWHGIQGGKYIGLDQPGRLYYSHSIAKNMTYIISAGTGIIPVWHQCTGVPSDRILPLGMPRTDAYIGRHKGDGHTVLADKRAYLYVPTFRDNGEPSFPNINWDYLDSMLTDNEILAIKEHPWACYQNHCDQLTGIRDVKRSHIISIPASEKSAPYLYDADVVITDYSSIMFDAYLLNKPVVLFEKRTGYTASRGMYLSYPDQYSSRYCTDEQSLIYTLRTSYDLRATEHDVLNLVADACDGHACERLCSLITDLNK